MAYLPQFDFDLYISSAPVDNLSSPWEFRGWVDQFYEGLGIELSRRLGRYGATTTWRNVGEHPVFDDTIRSAIEGSAIFLALISPGYLESEFCQKELQTFCETADASRYGLSINNRSRIFPVLLRNLPHSSWPPEIAKLGILGFPFHAPRTPWETDEHGYQTDPRRVEFQEQLRTLAQEIHRMLQSIRDQSYEEPSAVAEIAPKPVSPNLAAVVEALPEFVPLNSPAVAEAATEPVQPASSAVFISYRRGEGTPYAGRLYDRLAAHFGEDRVFMDLDTIEPGDDFVEVITNYVSSCSILIALINKSWLDVKDDEGRRRLHNSEDFVNLEISIALQRKIRVIPVLVQGALMPRSQDLPESLSTLSRRNALELSDSRWSYDVSKLIKVLEKYLRQENLPTV